MICCLFFCNKKPRGILSRVHASWSFLINKYRLSSDESTGLPWLLCPVVCLLPGISRSLMWCLCWSPLHHFCSHVSQCWLSMVQLAMEPAGHGGTCTILTISLQTTSRSQDCKNDCWKKEVMLLPSFVQCLYFTIHLSQRSSSIWQYQTQTHSHKCLPLQQPRQHHLPQLPSSVVVPLVVETSSE